MVSTPHCGPASARTARAGRARSRAGRRAAGRRTTAAAAPARRWSETRSRAAPRAAQEQQRSAGIGQKQQRCRMREPHRAKAPPRARRTADPVRPPSARYRGVQPRTTRPMALLPDLDAQLNRGHAAVADKAVGALRAGSGRAVALAPGAPARSSVTTRRRRATERLRRAGGGLQRSSPEERLTGHEERMDFTDEQIERYARHMRAEGGGRRRPAASAALEVLVIGAGGLGCPVTLYLAAAGSAPSGWSTTTWSRCPTCSGRSRMRPRASAWPRRRAPRRAWRRSTRTCA